MSKILIADDEETLRAAYRIFLEQAGHEVVTVADGDEALECLDRGETFDLFILDLVMPRMDGRTVLTGLRQRHIQVPVMLASAYLSEQTISLRHPVVEGLPKPFTRELLIQMVDGVLRWKKKSQIQGEG